MHIVARALAPAAPGLVPALDSCPKNMVETSLDPAGKVPAPPLRRIKAIHIGQ